MTWRFFEPKEFSNVYFIPSYHDHHHLHGNQVTVLLHVHTGDPLADHLPAIRAVPPGNIPHKWLWSALNRIYQCCRIFQCFSSFVMNLGAVCVAHGIFGLKCRRKDLNEKLGWLRWWVKIVTVGCWNDCDSCWCWWWRRPGRQWSCRGDGLKHTLSLDLLTILIIWTNLTILSRLTILTTFHTWQFLQCWQFTLYPNLQRSCSPTASSQPCIAMVIFGNDVI